MPRTPRKTKPSNSNAELRRFGVLLEHLDDKIGLVAEQYGDIQKSLEGHTEMLGSLATNVEIVKDDIEFIKHALKRKVDAEEFIALERRVALLERRQQR